MSPHAAKFKLPFTLVEAALCLGVVVFLSAAMIFALKPKGEEDDEDPDEEGVVDIRCYNGGKQMYHIINPRDYVVVDGNWLMVEEDEAYTNVIGAACVVKSDSGF
jgi:hypothetical protein